MEKANYLKPKVFVDSDVLFAGAASPTEHGASLLILRLAEITLIEAFVSDLVIAEVKRNLTTKIPQALPAFQHLVSRCVDIVPNPESDDLTPYKGLADPKDVPILAAAIQEKCSWLVSFNIQHYRPGHPDIIVTNPGDFILRIRDQLSHLSIEFGR